MARRRSSIGMRKPRKIGMEELKRTKYRASASSGNTSDKRFGFKSSKNGKVDVCVFYAQFAAKMFLDLMIKEDEIEWLDDNTILTERDVKVDGKNLRKIYDHRLTYNEKRYYELDEDHDRRSAIIRSDDHAKPFVAGSSILTKRRNSRKGMTLMRAIAEEVGMTPREARGILRSKMKKPKQGWAWRTAEDINRIKSILKGEPASSVSVDFSKEVHNEVEA